MCPTKTQFPHRPADISRVKKGQHPKKHQMVCGDGQINMEIYGYPILVIIHMEGFTGM